MRGRHPAAAPLAALALLAALVVPGPPASARPRPKAPEGHYNLDILGFNDGEPYRLKGAEAEAILGDPGAELFQFQVANWMLKNQAGAYVKVADAAGRFPERAATDLVRVYQIALDGDAAPEMLLVPTAVLNDGQHRYAPTLLKLVGESYRAIWSATELPGERYRVQDVRDLNGDGRLEVLLTGESGKSGFYQFLELVGYGKKAFSSLSANHVDSMHYVDLDGDGHIEVVIRERVGHRGPAYQWTYIDHLHRWDGARFVPADEDFPRYHDEQTVPTLIGDLIDHYTAGKGILDEKVDAITSVRKLVSGWSKLPRGFHQRKVAAMTELKRRRWASARTKLEALDKSYAYDAQVLQALAEVYAQDNQWELVLDAALRALGVDPTQRPAWWWAGLAFSQVSERSSAVACFYSLVNLIPPRDDGLAFLRARRGEPGMDANLQAAIDQALKELGAK